MTTFDASEIHKLAADLGRIPGKVVPEVSKVVTKGALNIKNQMRSDAQSDGSYKHFSGSISFDMKLGLGSIEAEIGPDKSATQGALGNILYFGTSKNGPVLDIQAPLDAEGPKFEKAIGDITDKLL